MSAFCTLSIDASVVIAWMMLLGLVVNVERRKRDTRRGIDLSKPIQLMYDATEKWQRDWVNSYKGRWTKGEWTKRKHDQVNYYLTQLLTV